MNVQRLRNLTTGRLHTEIGHVYQDLEYITGMEGIMTHMIPNVMRAVEPWLREQVDDAVFWEDEYKPDLEGEYELRQMDDSERKQVLERYSELPSPLEGKKVVAVKV